MTKSLRGSPQKPHKSGLPSDNELPKRLPKPTIPQDKFEKPRSPKKKNPKKKPTNRTNDNGWYRVDSIASH